MVKQKKGYLISFEGGEGGGKTTQVTKLAEYMSKLGKSIITTREPGGTRISEQIREVVLDTQSTNMSMATEVLLFQAARAQIFAELIIPALSEGKVILCDRGPYTSVIYQGIVRGFGAKMIEKLNDLSTQKTYPDLVFLLDVPVEIGLARRAQSGEMNRLDNETKEFHEKARQAYLEIAKNDKSGKWVIIDSMQSIERVYTQITEELKKRRVI
ncbi:dTMP kinase [Candidatus Beckwithbacteria bacterium]|nr:dTMP kinase [Candidatus Beckwithbacteria bacterium]